MYFSVATTVSINKSMKAHSRMAWVQYMLQHQSNQQIRKTTKQHIVDGTEQANSMLSSNSCIVKKAFQITGFSNVLRGLEDNLIHDDTVCKEIAEIMIFL